MPTETINDQKNIAGAIICRLRNNLGMTQRVLVDELEKHGVFMKPSTLSKIETGSRSITDIELVAFSKALNVEVNQLLDSD